MKIRFAIVGLGHIGRRHATLVAAHPGAKLVAVCDPLDRQELTWPDGVPEVSHFKDLAKLLQGSDFDVACICTPNGLHAAQAVACLAAGRHVVVEKPLALSVAECDAIIAAAHRYDRRVFGVMQNRYSPASAWLKEVIDSGGLGRVLQVHLDCFWNRDGRYYLRSDGKPHAWHGDPALDGGVLFTQFAHFLDLLCWTFDGVSVEHARMVNQCHCEIHPFADTGMVHFSLPGGGVGTLNFSTVVWDRNFESTFTVIGSRGTIKLGGQYMNEVRYCHAEQFTAPALPPGPASNNYGPYQGSAANHHFVIENVVDVLNGRAEVATTAAEGRAVVDLIERIHRASQPD
ncbi:Gfo/Idh/MocA family protein [Neolewinella litorea]|uniref:Gfo/Idh/MocA family oxidoreductase n=1 Tax=Neolewinella litorea TaxID=2562452 RepID=A0A4S4NFW3_9BACT|nr:Gfo/Idh/MocA family oxidoreductase [Neolewinella litorea]THH34960.1 Gfo/Idh/MocA family oxidoreductase [Neolewinella litorea]